MLASTLRFLFTREAYSVPIMRIHTSVPATLVCFAGLTIVRSEAGEFKPMTFDPHAKLQTDELGGVPHPSVEQLVAMHKGEHVLRARNGKLTRVPAEKTVLPFDPEFHPQGGIVYHATDELIYARQATLMSKSTDGGRTRTSWKVERSEGYWDDLQVLADGTFVRVLFTADENSKDPVKVQESKDEGHTWRDIAQIDVQVPGGYQKRYQHWTMTKLPDDTLFCGMDLRDEQYGGDRFLTSGTVLTAYRSQDAGHTWEGPIKVCDWAAEGGIVQLPSGSGKLLGSIRYQRGLLPDDSPATRELAGRFFKHHFLVDSHDGGLTWKNLRPLTTVLGQCYGYPAVQSDGTVVVIHDTRYGPGPDAARAMVSHDEGKTWENEVYYMYFAKGQSSYSRSVVLSDDTILTLGGTSEHPDAKKAWPNAIGHSHLTAIRWRPVKD